MQRITQVIFILLLVNNSFAQLQIFPLPKSTKCCRTENTRTKALEAMPLPFWDDFSYASETTDVPIDTLWNYGSSVWVNNGTGINPPSLGVASFDGVNSEGKPYSVNDILAKGISDSLVSRKLRMDLVSTADRASVFLSFYFQFRGNGEPPDAGDQLIVSVRNSSGKWVVLKVIENEGTFKSNEFYPIILPIAGDQYFHDTFQFRIHSFGRLSGPYDTWNVDYVYLNKGRAISESTSVPDRTITSPLTALFREYWSIPLNHFRGNSESSISPPFLKLHNMEFIPGSAGSEDVQTINYSSYDSIKYFKKGTQEISSHELNKTVRLPPLQPLEFRSALTEKPPSLSELSSLDTSVVINLKMWINSGDNVLPNSIDPVTGEPLAGDYDIKYYPIDFRRNDTTRAEYILSDYYAYDDGTAEYGASLVQPGSQLAYQFDQFTDELDTIVRVDLYFPKFGDETSQVMQLQILRDLSNSPGSLLYTENITIQRSQKNEVWQHVLSRPVGVTRKFYIGLKQTSSSIIAIGLDKNSDSGQKMFFNSNGTWIQNVNVKGSLMIRPAFGKGDNNNPPVGINEPKDVAQRVYPNPSHGVFFVPASSEHIHIFDTTGRLVDHEESIEDDRKRIQMLNPCAGIYVLKIFTRQEIYTQKIMVQP